MTHQSGIYEILNTVNGKRYIGSAVNLTRRRREHWAELKRNDHHCKHLQFAWNKYGLAAFEFNPILICAVDNLIMYEQICIDGGHPEYNKCRTAGSTLGVKHTAETRAKLSIARMGNTNCVGHVLTADHRANLAKARKGRRPALGMKHTSAARARISAALRLRPRKPASQTQKDKQSVAMMGHTTSAATREKLSKARIGNKNRLGIKHSDADKKKISEGLKLYHAQKKEQQP